MSSIETKRIQEKEIVPLSPQEVQRLEQVAQLAEQLAGVAKSRRLQPMAAGCLPPHLCELSRRVFP